MPLRWRKSSFSDEPDGNCVEVAAEAATFAVRDSKNTGSELSFSQQDWQRFLQDVGR
jgi:hypothetical protein